MKRQTSQYRGARRLALAALVAVAAGCSSMPDSMRGMMSGDNLSLSGSQEVPPVNTSASGKGRIEVKSDRTVSGSVTTAGMTGTMAHIHMGPAGQNGPVIIPLQNSGGGTWTVPANAKLTDAQWDAYQKNGLYVNVHSAAHPGGEVRAQLKP